MSVTNKNSKVDGVTSGKMSADSPKVPTDSHAPAQPDRCICPKPPHTGPGLPWGVSCPVHSAPAQPDRCACGHGPGRHDSNGKCLVRGCHEFAPAPASDALPPCCKRPEPTVICWNCGDRLASPALPKTPAGALQCSGCGRDFNEPLPETVVAVLTALPERVQPMHNGIPMCPICENYQKRHDDDCPMKAWIAAGRPGLPKECGGLTATDGIHHRHCRPATVWIVCRRASIDSVWATAEAAGERGARLDGEWDIQNWPLKQGGAW